MPYINHVCIQANVGKLEESIDFYRDWFGARLVPSVKFPVAAAWMLLGKVQLHLVESPERPSAAHHFAVTVEDRAGFQAVHDRAGAEGIHDDRLGHHLYEMLDGAVQLYITDPSGNLVECNYHDVSALSAEIRAGCVRWSDRADQSDAHLHPTLYMPEQAGLGLGRG